MQGVSLLYRGPTGCGQRKGFVRGEVINNLERPPKQIGHSINLLIARLCWLACSHPEINGGGWCLLPCFLHQKETKTTLSSNSIGSLLSIFVCIFNAYVFLFVCVNYS